MKLVNNLIHAGNKVFAYQGFAMARHFGIAEEDTREILLGSSARSFAIENWDMFDDILLNHTLAGTPAMLDLMAKDPWSAVVTARDAGLDLPIAALLASALRLVYEERINFLKGQRRPTSGSTGAPAEAWTPEQ